MRGRIVCQTKDLSVHFKTHFHSFIPSNFIVQKYKLLLFTVIIIAAYFVIRAQQMQQQLLGKNPL